MPMTPRCQPSPSTTSRRSAASSDRSARRDFNGAERGGFRVAAFAVEAFELGSEFVGASGSRVVEELDDFGGDVHAAGGVDARGEAESDIKAGDLFCGGVERGGGKERAQAGAGGLAEFAQAQGSNDPVFTAQRHGIGNGGDGGHLEEAGQGFFAGARGVAALENSLSELEGDGCAAKGFFRVGAAGLVGIEDGERVGDGVAGLEQMVVGDDEVEAEAAGGFCFSEGAHAGVDGDDEAHAVGIGGFKDAGLQAVALAEAMGDVKAGIAAEHFDGGLEQDDCGGAVDVVVAVEQDGLAGGDGVLEALDGSGHAEHEKGIVEVGDFRIEEGEACGGR